MIDGSVSTYGIDPILKSYSSTEFKVGFAVTDIAARKIYAGSPVTFTVLVTSNPSGYYTRRNTDA